MEANKPLCVDKAIAVIAELWISIGNAVKYEADFAGVDVAMGSALVGLGRRFEAGISANGGSGNIGSLNEHVLHAGWKVDASFVPSAR